MDLKRIYDRCEDEGECRVWQQGVLSTGYPQMSVGGKGGRLVTHLVLTLSGRPRPTAAHVATQRCLNRRCVSEHCLRWRLPSQVLNDCYRRGVRGGPAEYAGRLSRAGSAGFSKLTIDQVARIRAALAAGRTGVSLAREYGVIPKTIGAIKLGHAWRMECSPFPGVVATA
jgi:hypothetical protein